MTDTTAAPAPATTDTSFGADVARLGRVLFSPGAVFAELESRPTFWPPFIVVAILTAVINYFQRPFQQRVGAMMMERAGRTAPPDTMAKALISAAITPIGILIICAISAGILYAIASSLGANTTFKKMLTVVIYTWPALLLTQLITVVVLRMRGIDAIQGPQDMMVSLGLDNLLPADMSVGYFMRFVLAGIGPLQIWALIIAAVGVQVMGRASKGSAWATAILHFLIILVCMSALGAFGMKMMGAAAN